MTKKSKIFMHLKLKTKLKVPSSTEVRLSLNFGVFLNRKPTVQKKKPLKY